MGAVGGSEGSARRGPPGVRVRGAERRAASISITGPEEVVYDWTTMRCFEEDMVDGTTRAFRDALAGVQLTLGARTRA